MEKKGVPASSNTKLNGKEDTSKAGKYRFYKKPTFKKTALEVRQTKTSLKRQQQANPLMLLTETDMIAPKKACTKSHTSDNKPDSAKVTSHPPNRKANCETKSNTKTTTIPKQNGKQVIPSKAPAIEKTNKSPSVVQNIVDTKKSKASTSADKSTNGIRRSLSAEYFERKQGATSAACSQSSENVSLTEPVDEAYQQRSVARLTPSTSARRSLDPQSKILPTREELQRTLNGWLLKHGKNPTTFAHLQQLGGQKIVEKDKDNVEVNSMTGSNEDLHILPLEPKFKQQISEEGMEELVTDALQELFQLIQEEYPAAHCESWLELIASKCKTLKEEPEYWEFRAKIEQMQGNFGNAIEHYKTAIIQGAEVNKMDESLDMMLHKFSLLIIGNDICDGSNLFKQKTKIMKEFKDAFKSSVIKFAVQEKKLKSLDPQSKILPTREELQRTLNGWLLKHGKNPTTFAHLQQLGGQKIVEKDKDNVEVNSMTGSNEDLHILPLEPKFKQQISEEGMEELVTDALQELFQLIQEEYPAAHCESWLELIASKCKTLKEEPEYWEFRAKIEQMQGNFGNAIEHYKTAIIQGAEVNKMDESLDMMLHKFSLLIIGNDICDGSNLFKQKTKIMKEFKDAFKSSVIKFAVQEKKLKNNNIKIFVTPLRRSSRQFHSMYTSTPSVRL